MQTQNPKKHQSFALSHENLDPPHKEEDPDQGQKTAFFKAKQSTFASDASLKTVEHHLDAKITFERTLRPRMVTPPPDMHRHLERPKTAVELPEKSHLAAHQRVNKVTHKKPISKS